MPIQTGIQNLLFHGTLTLLFGQLLVIGYCKIDLIITEEEESRQHHQLSFIAKRGLFKYIENFTTKKRKIFR